MALEVTVWTDAPRVELVAQVLDLMGSAVTPIGVGGPRSAEVAGLASNLDTGHEDDFRKLLVERPSTYVLLATTAGLAAGDLRTALAGGSIILAIEPIAADFDDLAALRKRTAEESVGRIVRVPDLRQSPGWLSAADPGEVLGAVQSIAFWSFGRAHQCSLFARLHEAWQMVLAFAPAAPGNIPEAITASLTGPLPQVPEQLRAATGHLTAHAAASDGFAAAVSVSDHAGQTARDLNVIGQTGQLRISDQSYALYDSKGSLLDQRPPDASPATYADLIAGHWRRLIDQSTSGPGSAGSGAEADAVVVACCLASLLSARTHQPESPRKLLEMHR